MPKYINKFKSPEFIEETIIGAQGTVIGTVRIKPSSILWKPKNKSKFFSVSLEVFDEWIRDTKNGSKEVSS